jgi:hypothetical protein
VQSNLLQQFPTSGGGRCQNQSLYHNEIIPFCTIRPFLVSTITQKQADVKCFRQISARHLTPPAIFLLCVLQIH